ncbi:hypothetical protein [Cellulosimicrobium arenosum]|uniref:Uncharacterized protein n=1 Tax=Cellulosimicrobium arenosum TaxID=2708133 RepID=A0A927G6B3_9MICO|nr:hypothetical protein [Cellulosimicrobium arenosum]MBD8077806.1 hypothetical protein [Cellulosimicrobium arenosum]
MTSPRTRWSTLDARTRRAAAPTLVVLAAGAAAVIIGASWEHVLMLCAVAVAVALLWFRVDHGGDATWSRPPDVAREGARRDVSELGWAIVGRDGRVRERAARRVLALAEHQLVRHGVVDGLETPEALDAAARLLGARTSAGLQRVAAGGQTPTPRELQSWLDAIERLAPTPRTTRHEGTPR